MGCCTPVYVHQEAVLFFVLLVPKVFTNVGQRSEFFHNSGCDICPVFSKDLYYTDNECKESLCVNSLLIKDKNPYCFVGYCLLFYTMGIEFSNFLYLCLIFVVLIIYICVMGIFYRDIFTQKVSNTVFTGSLKRK